MVDRVPGGERLGEVAEFRAWGLPAMRDPLSPDRQGEQVVGFFVMASTSPA